MEGHRLELGQALGAAPAPEDETLAVLFCPQGGTIWPRIWLQMISSFLSSWKPALLEIRLFKAQSLATSGLLPYIEEGTFSGSYKYTEGKLCCFSNFLTQKDVYQPFIPTLFKRKECFNSKDPLFSPLISIIFTLPVFQGYFHFAHSGFYHNH